MTLTQAEIAYLTNHQRGCLATVAPDGSPQNKPVGFHYNADLGTIDIYGFAMEKSAKFRNIVMRPPVSFVVEDAVGEGAENMRFLEIRGRAEAAQIPEPAEAGLSDRIIRIHPVRVVGWNIAPDLPGLHSRDASPEAAPPRR